MTSEDFFAFICEEAFVIAKYSRSKKETRLFVFEVLLGVVGIGVALGGWVFLSKEHPPHFSIIFIYMGTLMCGVSVLLTRIREKRERAWVKQRHVH